MIRTGKNLKKRISGILSLVLMAGVFASVKAEAKQELEIRWLPEKYEIKSDGEFYSREGWVQEGLYVIADRETGLHGFAHTEGKIVIPTRYFAVGRLSEGLIAVEGDWSSDSAEKGFIDKSGRMILSADSYEFSLVHRGQHHLENRFAEGLVPVDEYSGAGESMSRQTHFIDKAGKKIVTLPVNMPAGGFEEGLAAAGKMEKQSERWGFIDKSGKAVIPFKYDSVRDFSEGLALVGMGNDHDPSSAPEKWGAIDKSGKPVVPMKYERLGGFHEGRSAFLRKGKWGYIDKSGKEIVPAKYDEVYDFSEGLAAVNIGRKAGGQNENAGKWGYIDKSGKVIVPVQYEDVGSFHQGLAPVKLGGKWGYIDENGKIVVAPQFDYAGDFSGGFAALRKKENGKLTDGIMKHPLKHR